MAPAMMLASQEQDMTSPPSVSTRKWKCWMQSRCSEWRKSTLSCLGYFFWVLSLCLNMLLNSIKPVSFKNWHSHPTKCGIERRQVYMKSAPILMAKTKPQVVFFYMSRNYILNFILWNLYYEIYFIYTMKCMLAFLLLVICEMTKNGQTSLCRQTK